MQMIANVKFNIKKATRQKKGKKSVSKHCSMAEDDDDDDDGEEWQQQQQQRQSKQGEYKKIQSL